MTKEQERGGIMSYNKLILVLLLLALILGGSVSWDEYTRTFEQQYDVVSGCKLLVAVGDGNIEVSGWTNSKVQIEAKLTVWAPSKGEAERMFARLNIKGQEQRVSITYTPCTLPGRGTEIQCNGVVVRRGAQINCKVFVPNESNLDLSLDDGIVSIKEVDGEVVIDGDDIDVVVERVKCDRFEIDSDDGDIEIVDFSGEVEIRSDDTDVLLKEVKSPNLYISTDDGSIDVETTIEKNGRYSFRTDDGDITIAIPDDAATRISIRKDDGRFESEFPILLQGSMDPHYIEGVIARDEARISISTDDGDVTIKRWTKE